VDTFARWCGAFCPGSLEQVDRPGCKVVRWRCPCALPSLATIQRETLQLNLPAAWAGPGTIAAWSTFSMNGLHWVGAGWGGIIAWLIARDLTRDREGGLKAAIVAFVPHLLLMVTVTWLVVTVIPPMQH
jgi:hypothetical protein